MQDSVHTDLERPSAATPPDLPPAHDFLRERSLKRELLAELRQSWDEGDPVPMEDLLARWPTDPASDKDVASLLFENYLHRSRVASLSAAGKSEHDAPPPPPDSVVDLFRNHEVLRSLGVSASSDRYLRMPEIGESVFHFRLERELGRGAFARVFLARQSDLAGRPVVLKVSQIEGTEPQTLAQLQHTNIVPIYSVHEDERAGLRVLCMPYFGGSSLSEVLNEVWRASALPRRGRELVRGLDAAMRKGAGPAEQPASAPAPGEKQGDLPEQTPRVRLGRLSYVQAVAYLGAALADGLAHAHQRRVLHRDIKPSNILLGSDGQPMLLDFNLAQDAAPEGAHALLGGTIAYMAPEHLRALSTRSPALARAVDHRADVYSLGMVLFEMLSGRGPFEQSASYTPLPMLVEAMAVERGRATPSVRKARPEVPWGVESILRRCLAPDPAQRYERAEHLAEDLRCFLDDLPLRHAPELSLGERAQKWARRHPRLTWAGAVGAGSGCLLLLALAVLVSVRAHLADTSDRLAVSRADERKRRFEEGAVHALFYVNTKNELADHLSLGEAAARDALDLYEILDRPDWQRQPDWLRLDAPDRARLAEEAREVLLLLAGARVRLARWDRQALTQALRLLDKAEAIPDVPPCQALWVDRATYLQHLGDAAGAGAARERARAVPAVTAHDHYMLAMAHVREQKYARAVAELDEAVRLNPRDYWAWMQRGLCHQELGDTAPAVGDFGTCVGLRPDFAWGYYNRAVALTAAGKRREAVADYAQALELDPRLLAARLNRGVLHLELKEYAPALAAFEAAEAAGRDDAALHSGLGIALEGLGRHEEADAAFARAEEKARSDPREMRERVRRAYGFAVAERLPARARTAFWEVLSETPDDAEALYGLGMLHDRRGEQTEALRYFSRALDVAPGFEEARRFRAVALARGGEFQAARQDINACLSKEAPSGATYYAAACVAALHAERVGPGRGGESVGEALRMLREAFVRGYGVNVAGDDQDLKGIQDRPEFARLLADGPSLAADK
jgi:serine/threonine protein kinase/Flp pilus assembly protein TadD